MRPEPLGDRWPAKRLGSLFFKAPLNRVLYFYGGTAKLVGDDSIPRCTFSKTKVVCRTATATA
jgi:hypothetical protein